MEVSSIIQMAELVQEEEDQWCLSGNRRLLLLWLDGEVCATVMLPRSQFACQCNV